MNKLTTCFFTGHRDIPDIERVRTITERNIIRLYNEGYRDFICGGAIGFDQLAAEILLGLRKMLDIRLHIYIPCEDQDKYFTPEQKRAYAYVREQADSVWVMYPKYVRGCMHARNRAMADDSSVCISYLTKSTGGTAYTVDYAHKKRIKVINVG